MVSPKATVDITFLSTPSARRATEVCGADRRICEISIHALREEGDVRRDRHGRHGIMISIHALREEGDAAAARLLSSVS